MPQKSDRQLRWVGWSDLRSLSAMLRDTFSPGSRLSRIRYSIKLLTTPHLTTADADVVVGIVTSRRRARTALRWQFDQRGRAFDRANIPVTLKRSENTWRIVNLAASKSAIPSSSVRLAWAVIALADTCDAIMSFASSQETRFIETYRRLGFVQITSDLCPEFIREPHH